MDKKIIAIDFDGVIVPENFPHINGFMENAKETILDLYKAGYVLILWTARTNEYKDEDGNPGGYLQKALDFLKEENILHCFTKINDNISDKYNCRKIYANIYIDDRDINGFKGWNFAREKLL